MSYNTWLNNNLDILNIGANFQLFTQFLAYNIEMKCVLFYQYVNLTLTVLK